MCLDETAENRAAVGALELPVAIRRVKNAPASRMHACRNDARAMDRYA